MSDLDEVGWINELSTADRTSFLLSSLFQVLVEAAAGVNCQWMPRKTSLVESAIVEHPQRVELVRYEGGEHRDGLPCRNDLTAKPTDCLATNQDCQISVLPGLLLDGRELSMNTRPLEVSSVRDYRCSFCGKRQDQVKKLIAGQREVFICDQCVDLCHEIIGEEFSVTPRPDPTPRRESWLDRFRRMAVSLPR